MKTPLPEKVGQNTWVSESTRIAHLTIAVNQLIDVVAELTELVESVNTREVPRFIGLSQRIQIPPPPLLKETLLEEIKSIRKESVLVTEEWKNNDCFGTSTRMKSSPEYNKALSDVEEIINRLMP